MCFSHGGREVSMHLAEVIGIYQRDVSIADTQIALQSHRIGRTSEVSLPRNFDETLRKCIINMRWQPSKSTFQEPESSGQTCKDSCISRKALIPEPKSRLRNHRGPHRIDPGASSPISPIMHQIPPIPGQESSQNV